ncbi:bifunctional [glutamine synthetase] adenylyltransferase/[glutamine synthetase]-adenylyl-L-tyrosine phosphorylase [Nocardia cyriacigeorgica]|uniref:bifunctional [glutamine synthetase] adenylyltransferase/[glutamine synthetase]-adenylyl-L-tyrosine phosphorylase n=1 Tax=Nocardia cyriacigeorgica TaxID=135487 RepID=UPI001894B2DE|nr:bifunctional [glutamine synthetase] adenylyltransferase/[glutamine synthetase]-adenylyl-L-tyrosine phosphorylase [Nocardia cyriacigeorgica]MBF6157696.1 bifunctional [glutamine synthetase] adenylyltransferase/[glutamine synthetase]-adenylyl-L-tyrosine phosphorylase [Nocardia cyriacigeorgica]MBF6196668.1 bifunctional [glutamine synthetase] adenylyltransferase/[glutamine synthetase]-adenylyl-L-tyrosine phosphorylase [Nocardia cyriacigeorgica]MBF6516823.1 bifunctional [glutamine synthetase] adeny
MVRPPTARSAVPGVGRLGLLEPTAAASLAELAWDNIDGIPLLWALSRAPDADLALNTIIRLREALGDQWAELDSALRTDTALRGRLFALVGSSTAFGDHLVADPSAWKSLRRTDLPDRDEMVADLLDAVDAVAETGPNAGPMLFRAGQSGPEVVALLRKRYRDQLMLLAAQDLAATVENEPVLPYQVVGRHLTDLADAALTAALSVAVARVCRDEPCPVRLAVIAMGKCGARELNYVSDVDIVFAAEPADATAARLAAEMMSIGSAAFFEVDAALRPEGKAGALVRTLDSHIAYYQRWARTWEFQALLKARPMTGDLALGEQYRDALMPMVWSASERPDFVPDVQAMRRRVEDLVPADLRERELKLGHGSLRDVEFAVQLLQLVHGRVDDTLHVQGTVEALTALAAGGYVGRDDAANLTASYEFLRLLEHRLQLQRLKRTHTLPADDDEEGMRWLARAAHMRPDGRQDAMGVLRTEIRRNTVRVRRLHAKLFYRPLLESVARLDSDALRLSPDAAVRQLAALGYAAPEHALGHLRALTGGVSRKGRIQALLLPTLLEWLGETPNPDAGLLAYRRVSEGLAEQTWFLRELRDEGAVAQRLMIVLGSSAYLPDLLINAPETIRMYADGPGGPLLLGPQPEDVARGILTAAARYDDPNRAVAAARSLRRHELARVASADLLGLLDVPQVCRALSSVWVAVLEASLRAVIRASEAERGAPAPADFAVIGMGRLGGMELGYGSDADVLFVCDPRPGEDETKAVRWATGIAERVQRMLGAPSTDPPLQVDAALRPEGRNGALVRTLASYAAYYEQWVQPWEVQALLRAHQVAGDQELGVRFLHLIDKVRYPAGGVSAEAVREIRRIKARVDSERLPRGADPATHTKLGRGGLADIEWTVQLMQLRHAHEVPELHNTSTLEALDVIEQKGLLDPEDVDLLRQAWLIATKARNALVQVRGKPSDQLPAPGPQLSAVAYAAGWRNGDGGEFLDNYMRITRRAKGVVERVFGS